MKEIQIYVFDVFYSLLFLEYTHVFALASKVLLLQAATSRHPQSVLKPQPSRGQAVVNNTGDLVHSSSSSPTTTILVSAANGSILTTTTHTGSQATQHALRQATLSGGAPTVALATTTPSSTLKPFSLVTNRYVVLACTLHFHNLNLSSHLRVKAS